MRLDYHRGSFLLHRRQGKLGLDGRTNADTDTKKIPSSLEWDHGGLKNGSNGIILRLATGPSIYNEGRQPIYYLF